MTTIVAISDLHGQLPPDGMIPTCDLLLIAGDICPCNFSKAYMGVEEKSREQYWWLKSTFKPWLEKQPVKETVATWGNHDWIGEKNRSVPPLPWHLLIDQGIELFGLKIYGSPWQTRFFDWAFNADEDSMEKKWNDIPDDTDILVLHGPPHGYGDLAWSGVGKEMVNTGSPSLTQRILDIKLKLAVAGHIHGGYGVYKVGDTTIANVSLLNEQYVMTNKPFSFELD
jgi:Icc-related predicted phosphoesterase